MDSTDLKNYLMNTLCRICAEKSSKLVPILEVKLLPLKIDKCLPIEVTAEDDLPVNICEMCLIKIDESYLLYETCFYADQRLKNLWKTFVKPTTDEVETFESEGLQSKQSLIGKDNFPPDYVVDNKKASDNMLLIVGADTFDGTFDSQDLSVRNKINDVLIHSDIIINVSGEPDYTTLNCRESDKLQNTSLGANNAFSGNDNFEHECIVSNIPVSECNNGGSHESAGEGIQEKPVGHGKNAISQESNHSREKPFLCDTCGKSFKKANNLKSHVKIHSEHRKKFNCKICSKSFFTKFFLQEHMNTHTGETPYKCEDCGKEFKEKVHLRQHKWTHSTEKFLCPVCGSRFNRKGNMMEHIKKYHTGNEKEKQQTKKFEREKSTESKFSCTLCKKNFSSQTILKNHQKCQLKKKSHCCSLCGKQFRHSGSLTYHRRTAHTGEKPFQCTYCDQKFSLRSLQRIHERKTHTFEYPYKCSNCFRVFSNSSSLKNHSYVHMKEKLFECDICRKKFSRNSNLFVHKKIHSDDRQYTCEQCGKSYIQKHDMIKHKKVHDPKSKPFFCKYCGNSFAHKKDFAKHAMCHFDYIRRKSNADVGNAEKMLDAVTGNFQKSGKTLIDAERIILESSIELHQKIFKI